MDFFDDLWFSIKEFANFCSFCALRKLTRGTCYLVFMVCLHSLQTAWQPLFERFCSARFSALSGVVQACENSIQGQKRQNINSLKVCWSAMGFFQNSSLMPSGHLFNGKNASLFNVRKISLHCSTTSLEER